MTSVNRSNVPVGSTFTNPLRVIDIKDSDHLQAAKFSSNLVTCAGTAIKSIPKEVPLKSAHYRAYIIAIVQDKIDLTGRLKLCWIVRTGEDFPVQLNYLVQGTNLEFTGDLAVKSWSSFKQGDAEVPAGSHRYIFLHRLGVNDVTVTACIPQTGFHGMLDGESKEEFEKRSASLQLALQQQPAQQQQNPVQQQHNPVQQQQQLPLPGSQQPLGYQQQPVYQQPLGYQQQSTYLPSIIQPQPSYQQPGQQQLIPGQQQLIPGQQQLNPAQQPNSQSSVYPQPVDTLTTTVMDVPDNGRKRKEPDQDPSDLTKVPTRHQKNKPTHDGPSKSSQNPQSGADMEMS